MNNFKHKKTYRKNKHLCTYYPYLTHFNILSYVLQIGFNKQNVVRPEGSAPLSLPCFSEATWNGAIPPYPWVCRVPNTAWCNAVSRLGLLMKFVFQFSSPCIFVCMFILFSFVLWPFLWYLWIQLCPHIQECAANAELGFRDMGEADGRAPCLRAIWSVLLENCPSGRCTSPLLPAGKRKPWLGWGRRGDR